MRVAVVAGPDPGHAFPAIALCLRFLAAGDDPALLTGRKWLQVARQQGICAVELDGLDPTAVDDDGDDGAKIHRRAARMAVLNAQRIGDLAPDVVISDSITVCGGLAAELLGLPWIELNAHPLYRPSKGLPPVGSGLAPGAGMGGWLRDSVMRSLSARSWR
ncbi:MAG: glycosyl transferase, partial [Mycobacterium sp.]